VEKLKQLARVHRQEVKAFLPDTVQCIHGVLQNSAQEGTQDSIGILFEVSYVVKRHPALRAEVAKSACKELVVGMLQATAQHERTYTNPRTLSQICVAQYNLQISCEQFWQQMPETCIQAWDHRAACSVVYAYGKLYEGKAVSSSFDHFAMVQHKIVAHHAKRWDAQGVSTVAWSLSKQRLLLGEAAESMQKAAKNTAASMDAQAVVNT
jgi:hypothetical protein